MLFEENCWTFGCLNELEMDTDPLKKTLWPFGIICVDVLIKTLNDLLNVSVLDVVQESALFDIVPDDLHHKNFYQSWKIR